jgi:ethanolamine utilization protein EutN
VILGRVIGNVVSTQKHAALRGRKILMVEPIDPGGERHGKVILAVDTVQAGPGDRVLVLDEGNSGRMILEDSMAPVRTVIVGIVDAVDHVHGA